MSAVFGLLRLDGAPAAPRDIERMGRVLAHRGPDGTGAFVDGPMALGHRLLRVNQEDRFEQQPLEDRAGAICLAADLRLDNRDELAGAFGLPPGERAQMPDSALLLKAYQKWGRGCAAHLLGDFAFAIWDAKAQTLTLGRDHMGQRDLFYHRGERVLAFASEIKGLWALADVPRQLLDMEVARLFLLRPDGRAPGATMYDGIMGLTPGTVMTVERDGRTTLSRYWEPAPAAAHEGRDTAYYIAAYRETLAEAVACRVRRLIKPPSLMLSGGFDSSAIAGLAGAALPPNAPKILGFSSVVPEAYRGTIYDIRRRIEQCRRVMPHLEVRYVPWQPQSPLQRLEQHFVACDGPAPGNHYLLKALYEEAAQDSRLMMDGIGGDYTLNPRGHAAIAWQLRHGRLKSFLSELAAWRARSGRSYPYILTLEVFRLLLPQRLRNAVRRLRRGYRTDRDESLIAPAMMRRMREDGGLGRGRPGQTVPPTMMRQQMLNTLNNIARKSAGGARLPGIHGMDFTRPFHDRRVVELGLAIPESLYVVGGRNRWLACQALADIYPAEFLNRDRGNEALTPNIPEELEPLMPSIAEEAGRLSSDRRLREFLNLQQAQSFLDLPTTRLDQDGIGRQVRATRAVLMARFVEWFERGQRNDA